MDIAKSYSSMSWEVKFMSMDPSLRNTAIVYGTIDLFTDTLSPTGYFIINTEKSKDKTVRQSSDTVRRARSVISTLSEFIDDWKPDICFAETPSGSKSSSAMKSYGMSCCFIALMDPPAIQVSPIELKKVVNGTNRASKDEIIEFVKNKFPEFELETKSDGTVVVGRMEHVADAVVAACAGIETSQYGMLKKVIVGLNK